MIKRVKDRNNLEVNLDFLRASNKENHLKANGNLLRKLAYRFSLWEENYVFALEDRYDTFRENIIGLDYDEMLEMYLMTVVRPNQEVAYWNDDCYKYFRENILEQINTWNQHE